MCTAVSLLSGDFYFGRNLDYEFSYGDQITVTPRNYPFSFLHMPSLSHHYAMIGMACVMDDYPLYYEMGEKTMPLAEDVVLKDSSADPQAEAVETMGADAVAAAINADPDNWTTYNTTLVVQGGKVLEVRRIWVP